MILPRVAIVFITYNRPVEARTTIAALHQHLHYDGELAWHIADDHSPDNYGNELRAWANHLTAKHVTLLTTPSNVGWGANANHALRGIKDRFIFQIEDDYVLRRPINITPYVLLMMEKKDVGLIRLDGIAGHRVTAHAGELDVSKWIPDYRAGYSPSVGKMFYWQLEVESRETWIYSNRPHLKHRRFIDAFGPYPEGYKLGITEERYAHTVKDVMRRNAASPQIVVPMELCLPAFDHIGLSYQHTEHDRGRV